MKISEYIKILQSHQKKYGDVPVYTWSPVEGDSEAIRETKKDDIYLDDRYPALVLFW